MTPLDWAYSLARSEGGLTTKCTNHVKVGGEIRRLVDPVGAESQKYRSLRSEVRDLLELPAYVGGRARVQPSDANDPGVASAGVLRNEHPQVAEILASGVLDPVFLNVLDCMVWRALLEDHASTFTHILHRSQFYRLATPVLAEIGVNRDSPPLFFEARHRATMAAGAGLSDIVEFALGEVTADRWLDRPAGAADDAEGDRARAWIERHLPLAVLGTDSPPPALSARGRWVERAISEHLFARHRGVLRRLAHRLEEYDGTLFDPLGRGRVESAREFDVRMVLFEEGIVEDWLRRHRPDVADAIDPITASIRHRLALVPEEGAHGPYWTRYVAGELVRDLAEGNTRRKLKGKGIAAKAVFEPDFANYWWRVAIGVAEILALHSERDDGPVATRDAGKQRAGEMRKDYLETLAGLVAAAPPAQVGPEAAHLVQSLRAVRGEAGLAVDEDRAALRAGLAVLFPLERDPPDTGWYGCSLSDDGPNVTTHAEPALPKDRREWKEVLKTLDAPEHAATLASAYESAAHGGASDRPPSLDPGHPLAEKACTNVELRRTQTACLLAPGRCADPAVLERPSTLLGPVQEGERVEFLAYEGREASALRAALPVLWPFLATAIRRDPYLHEKSLDELVASVLAERDTWHRRVEQARLLTRSDQETNDTLGFQPPEYYRKLLSAAEGKEAALGPFNFRAISSRLEGIKGSANAPDPWEVPAERVSRNERRTATATGTRRWQAGVFFELERNGSHTTDGRPLHSARAVFRIRTETPSTTAHACGGSYTECRSDPGTPGTSTYERTIPLGLEIHNVVVEPDGALRAIGKQRDIKPNPSEARAFLGGFGIPEFFTGAQPTFRVTKDLGTLDLWIEPRLHREPIPRFSIRLLEEGKPRTDLAEQVIEGITASLLEAGARQLAALVKPLWFQELSILGMTIALKLDPEADEPLRARLRHHARDSAPAAQPRNGDSVADGAPGSPDVKSLADLGKRAMGGLRVEVEADFVLSLEVEGKDDVNVTGTVTLRLDENGLRMHTLELDEEALARLSNRIGSHIGERIEGKLRNKLRPLTVDQDSGESRDRSGQDGYGFSKMSVRLVARPGPIDQDTEGVAGLAHAFRLAIGATLTLPPFVKDTRPCIVPLSHEIPLSELGNLAVLIEKQLGVDRDEAGFKAAIESIQKCAKQVVVDKVFDSADQYFADAEKKRTLDMFGMEWQLECGKDSAGKPECFRDVEGQPGRLAIVVARPPERARGEDGKKGRAKYTVRDIYIEFLDGRPKLHIKDLSTKSKADLGEAVLLQLRLLAEDVLGKDFLGKRLEVTKPEMGQLTDGTLYFEADVALRNLPYLNDAYFGRLNLLNLHDPDEIRDALLGWAVGELGKAVAKKLAGTLDLEQIGTLEVKEKNVKLTVDDARPILTVEGQLKLSLGVNTDVKLTLPLLRPEDIRVEADPRALDALLGALARVVEDKIPFIGERLAIRAPEFGELETGSGRYGMAFGAKVDFTPFVAVEIERIVLTRKGLELDGSFRGEIPVDLELSAVTLSKMNFVYHTGRNGGKSGLTVGADITPIQKQLGRLAKLEADVDLTEVGSLKVSVHGDLIALNQTPLLEATGEISLTELLVRVDARAKGQFAEILSPELKVWIDGSGKGGQAGPGGAPSLGVETALSFFGAELARLGLRADLGENARAAAHASASTPIGGASLDLRSRLDLSAASLEGQVSLGLWKWKLIDAGAYADETSARAWFKVFWFPITLSKPSFREMSGEEAEERVRGALGVDEATAAKLDPSKTEITALLVGADGAVREWQLDVADPRPDSGPPARVPTRREPPPDAPAEPTPPPERAEPVEANKPEEASELDPAAEVFQRVTDPEETDEYVECGRLYDDHYTRRLTPADQRVPAFESEEAFVDSDPGDPRTFRWKPANRSVEPCIPHDGDPGRHPVWNRWWQELGIENARLVAPHACDADTNSPWIELIALRTREGAEPLFGRARRPLFCWQDQGHRTEAVGELFVVLGGQPPNPVHLVVTCPAPSTVASSIRGKPLFSKVCGKDRASFRLLGRIEGETLGLERALAFFEKARSDLRASRSGDDARAPAKPVAVDLPDGYRAELRRLNDPDDRLLELEVRFLGEGLPVTGLGVGQIPEGGKSLAGLLIGPSDATAGVSGKRREALRRQILRSWLERAREAPRNHLNASRPRLHFQSARTADAIAITFGRTASEERERDLLWMWTTGGTQTRPSGSVAHDCSAFAGAGPR